MKTYLAFFILFYAFISYCQEPFLPLRPYEPIQFINVEPIWYHTIKDTTPSNVEGNGYNFLYHNWRCLPEVKENHLYTSYLTTFNGDAAGAYLEKRNLNTGDLIWNHPYGQRNLISPEVTRKIVIEEDSVKLISWRSKDGFNTWPPFFLVGIDVTLVERSFSDNTGQIGSAILGDSLARKFTANPRFIHKVEYIVEDESINGYRCIYQDFFSIPNYILSVPLDRYGRQVGIPDTVFTERVETFFVLKNDDNKIVLNKRLQDKMYMCIYSDASLRTLEDIWELESFDLTTWPKLVDIDGVNTIWTHTPNGGGAEIVTIYHRNKIESQIQLEEKYLFSTLKYIDKRVVGFLNYTEFDVKLDIVELGNNELRVLNTLLPKDSLRFLLPYYLTYQNDLLIVHFEEGSAFIDNRGRKEQDFPSKAFSIMAFTLESLGITSSTNDNSALVNPIHIYPNPTSTDFTIEGMDKGEVSILDISGKERLRLSYFGDEAISVAHLEAGLYIVKTVDAQGHLWHRKLLIQR